MAKRTYENKLEQRAKQFTSTKINTETINTAETISPNHIKSEDRKKEIEEEAKEPQKNLQQLDEENSKEVTEAALKAIQALISSGKIEGLRETGKVGRPKRYPDKMVSLSFRLKKSNYDHAYKMGRTEFKSMTDYLNHLVDEDIKKRMQDEKAEK